MRLLLGTAPAALLALLLVACAPALNAAPAAGSGAADAGVRAGSGSGSRDPAAVPVADQAGAGSGATSLAPVPVPVAELALAGAGAPADASAGGTQPASIRVAAPQDPPAKSDPQPTSDPPSTSDPPAPSTAPASPAGIAARVQVGIASWYGPKFAGRLTSDGEIFVPSKLTAAHRTLPFGTLVKVTNLVNGKSVVVRINDRGPFKPNRIIDLSEGAAKAIGMYRMGVARVRLEPLALPNGVVRLGVDAKLSGYRVLSRFHKVGQLLVLSKRDGDSPVVVRVVGTDVPPSTGADVLVAQDVYKLLGPQAHLTDH